MTRIEPFETNQAPARPKRRDRLGSLYESHGSAATKLAYVLTGDTHGAQDVAFEAFVKIGSKIFGLRDPDHERAYLYRTIVNLSRGRARRLKTEREALGKVGRSATHHAQLPDIGERDEMWQALLQLPIRQRAALFLRYYQDLSEAQTADTLECSLSALKSLVNRGLKELRTHLEGRGDD